MISKDMAKFKIEAKHYSEYLVERDNLYDQLEQIQYDIDGVHSTDFETTYKRISRNERNILPQLEAKKIIEQKYEIIDKKIQAIENVIFSITLPVNRVFAWEAYILREPFVEIGLNYAYNQEAFRRMVSNATEESVIKTGFYQIILDLEEKETKLEKKE